MQCLSSSCSICQFMLGLLLLCYGSTSNVLCAMWFIFYCEIMIFTSVAEIQQLFLRNSCSTNMHNMLSMTYMYYNTWKLHTRLTFCGSFLNLLTEDIVLTAPVWCALKCMLNVLESATVPVKITVSIKNTVCVIFYPTCKQKSNLCFFCGFQIGCKYCMFC